MACKFVSHTNKTLTPLGLAEVKNCLLPENSICVSCIGSDLGKVVKTQEPSVTNQQINSIIPYKDFDADFVYYLMCIVGKDLNFISKTSTAVPIVNKSTFSNYKVRIPQIGVQKAIGNILSSLDDKIELNRKINSNLEEQAKALFKSWFIDFEPFKGGKFIDSELGMIPEGWNVKSASDIFNITIGKTPPRKESKWFTKGIGNVWVSISDMKLNGAFIGHSSEKLSDDAIAKFNIVMVPKDTILLSFKLTIGRVAISSCDLTTNEAIARFSIDNPRLREFTYLFLKNYNYQSLGSTSSIATAVNSKIIKSMPFLLPDADTTESFHKLSKPLFDQIEVTQKQTYCLASIRDTLLPKLMSGEIDVEHSKLLFILRLSSILESREESMDTILCCTVKVGIAIPQFIICFLSPRGIFVPFAPSII